MGKKIYAYCYASGLIEFGERVPDGALPVFEGEEGYVRKLIEVTARHAYDGVSLLVPGVPEAPEQMAAVDALIRFRAWLHERPGESGEVVHPDPAPRDDCECHGTSGCAGAAS